MKAVIQRVSAAKLSVDGEIISNINKGLCVYIGIEKGDSIEQALFIVKKIANLRIFENEQGKMDYSVQDVGGEILLISQFTLLGECKKGNRPDFTKAEFAQKANDIYLLIGSELEKLGICVKYGQFGAKMVIDQVNEGPVTIIIEK